MTVTIPHKLTQGKELVILPLEEYEALIQLKEIYEFQPTVSQKKALVNARRNRKSIEFQQFQHPMLFSFEPRDFNSKF